MACSLEKRHQTAAGSFNRGHISSKGPVAEL
jgi:hypothetical protein